MENSLLIAGHTASQDPCLLNGWEGVDKVMVDTWQLRVGRSALCGRLI